MQSSPSSIPPRAGVWRRIKALLLVAATLAAAVCNTETREQTLDPKTLDRLKSLGYIK